MPLTIGCDTEKLEKYYHDGFCPVEIGDRITDRFTVLHKLGYGGFGTVWLVRDDEKRHGRYVALKVVASADSEEYESKAVMDRLRNYERDHGSPGLFLLELERVFIESNNGRHLCQVFPILGPSLDHLVTVRSRLYPSFVKPFARQLAAALDAMHSMGVCHGDLTLSNIAVRLDKSLDALTEAELAELFGEPRTEDLKRWYSGDSSCFPKLAFETAQLKRLPPDYLSANLCILDFDQAFLSEHPPKDLAHVPVRFMAPESIFTLTNSPAADVWALGSILFHLRDPFYLFVGLMASDPEGAVSLMHEVLGDLPSEWRTFPFLDGYPVHEPLQPDVEYDTLEGLDELAAAPGPSTLEQRIDEIVEPHRPVTETANPNVGAAKFCLEVPQFTYKDQHKEEKFLADNSTPIKQDDAALFANLLRRIFTWDYQSRITAKEILEHPWVREPDQTLPLPEPEQGVESPPQESDQPKTSTPIVPVQLPARTADTVETKAMDTEVSEASSLDKGVGEQETGTEGAPQRDTGN